MLTETLSSSLPAFVTTESGDNAQVFAEWLHDYGGILVKVARSFASDPEDQRDLKQQMHLQIWRSIGSFGRQAKVSTWIYRICLNTSMTWQRTEKRRRVFLQSLHASDLVANEHSTPDDPRLEALYSAIRELRPADRALILLYLEERSYQEIAEILGITVTNTGVRLQRVKQELAEYLKKQELV
jgi:RNA polymerase sigma-70 factor (ECF subfamily)